MGLRIFLLNLITIRNFENEALARCVFFFFKENNTKEKKQYRKYKDIKIHRTYIYLMSLIYFLKKHI